MTRDEFLARPTSARLRQLADPSHPAYRQEYDRLVDELVAEANAVSAYPPLWRQAAGLAGAVVTHVAAGLPTLDAEAVAARLAVCAGCPEHVAAENRCRICGCSLSLKAGWADQKCPLGKWPKD